MKIKCWVVWWKGDKVQSAGPCDGGEGPLTFDTKKRALAECQAWKDGSDDRFYTVRRATLTIEEPTRQGGESGGRDG